MKATQYNKYPAYKDSGEYWMGEVPSNWELKRLKHLFYEKKIKHNPELNCGSISFGKVVYKDDDKIPLSTKASYQEVLDGEYLINPLNLNYDLISLRIALSDKNVVVSSGYIVLKEKDKINKDYYKWLLHKYDVAYMKLLGSGVRQTINFNHIANSNLVFPPLSEQTAIATFLDEKTAKIDKAIAQKEKLIALLKERKQILIQEAVTGKVSNYDLNDEYEDDDSVDKNDSLSKIKVNQKISKNHSSRQMKDSGVEWIGEIPEEWEVKRAKYMFFEVSERSEDGSEELLSVSHMTGVTPRSEKDVNMFLAEDYSGSKLCQKGDVVYNIMWAWMGALGVAYQNGIVSPSYGIYRQNSKDFFNSKFLEYKLKTTEYIEYYNKTSTGLHSSRLRFYAHMFMNMEIAYPTRNEQDKIISYIETQSSKIDKAISLQEQQIEKLKEYKSVLVDSAVTGKIKVS